jgi:hypothetical protein
MKKKSKIFAGQKTEGFLTLRRKTFGFSPPVSKKPLGFSTKNRDKNFSSFRKKNGGEKIFEKILFFFLRVASPRRPPNIFLSPLK